MEPVTTPTDPAHRPVVRWVVGAVVVLALLAVVLIALQACGTTNTKGSSSPEGLPLLL